MAARRGAFTLIEVLVSVAIISLLISILLPALKQARATARSTVCLSQLRQMAVAAQSYASSSSASYPPYMDTVYEPEFQTFGYERKIEYAWDYTRVHKPSVRTAILPGLLWQGKTVLEVQQCPSFEGPSTWSSGVEDPFTGYNYNTSYVGTFRRTRKGITVSPARQDQIRRPGRCAVFGDGEWANGANKFMRSPWGAEKGARDSWASTERAGGTQGFRHLKETNASFADGHAESLRMRYTDTYEHLKDNLTENIGFLSADNSMYSLDGASQNELVSN